jgi:hypothetical protein
MKDCIYYFSKMTQNSITSSIRIRLDYSTGVELHQRVHPGSADCTQSAAAANDSLKSYFCKSFEP